MVVLLGIVLLVFSFFVFRFHKVEAMWGSIPVVITAFISMLALAWFIPRTRWFQHSHDHTPMGIFLIPLIGFIISLWRGLARMENFGVFRATPTEPARYNTVRASGILVQGASDAADMGLSISLPRCDGDACAAYLVVGLIILVLILIVGSAVIPHFWLLSSSLLLGIMALIAFHDLRLRPKSQRGPVASER
jgi:hypothetical protein